MNPALSTQKANLNANENDFDLPENKQKWIKMLIDDSSLQTHVIKMSSKMSSWRKIDKQLIQKTVYEIKKAGQ